MFQTNKGITKVILRGGHSGTTPYPGTACGTALVRRRTRGTRGFPYLGTAFDFALVDCNDSMNAVPLVRPYLR